MQTPWWGKIGLIWLILVPLVMVVYVLAQPLAPNDFWYHLRAGEWMVTHRSFPRVAMFTTSVPAGTPYFYQSWIAEIIMYLTLKWSGLAGSQILRAVCFGGAIAIFIAAAQHRAKVLLAAPGVDAFNNGARRVAIIGLPALYMCIPNADMRPQAFSVPLFAIFAAIIFAWPHTNRRQLMIRAACLIGMMTVWANTHGAFATGLIMLCLFCIGETLHFYFGKSLTAHLGSRFSKTQLQIMWIAFIGSLAAVCINPRGLGIYTYVYALAENPIGKKYIQEWQPPTWTDSSNAVFFCCGIAILLMLILIVERYRNKQKAETNQESTFGALGLRPGELLLIAAFFVMGLRNVRSILWFALVFIIVGTALLCRIYLPKVQETIEVIPPSMQRMNLVLVVIISSLVILFLPRFKPLLPWPETYIERFAPVSAMRSSNEFEDTPPMMLSENTPVAATAFLRENPPRGLLWNDMVFGSYLVWALPPNNGPWADPRIEMRPNVFWETYIDTSHGENNPSATLNARGFSDILINKKASNQDKLKSNLSASSQWVRRYEDDISILFTYRPPKP